RHAGSPAALAGTGRRRVSCAHRWPVLKRRASPASRQSAGIKEEAMSDAAPLRDAVSAQMKEAMKTGDRARVGALRLIMAALKDREIEARGAGKIVSRADELALLTKMVKSRQDSAMIYA